MHTKQEDLQTPKPPKNVSNQTAVSRDLAMLPSAPPGTGPISSLRMRREQGVGLRGCSRASRGLGGSLIGAVRENLHLTRLLIRRKVITCIIRRKRLICPRRMDSKIKLLKITTFQLLNHQCNSTSADSQTWPLSRTLKPQTSVSESSDPSLLTLMLAWSEKPMRIESLLF